MNPYSSDTAPGWAESCRAFLHPRVITMLFFGFSAGIPLLLIFSSLSLWLREAGVERSAVTFFSWAALGYSFKFIWAPLIDRLPLPVLTRRLGRRRGWLLVAQLAIVLSIIFVGSIDPARGDEYLTLMALAAVLLGFSAATQDIVIDAYRIEAASVRLQAMMASSYIAGYRLGTIVSGAGALFIASSLGTRNTLYQYSAWQWTYYIMAAAMLVGIVTTLVIAEPDSPRRSKPLFASGDHARIVLIFLLAVSAFALCFFYSGSVFVQLHTHAGNDPLIGFLLQTLRLLLAIFSAGCIGWLLIRAGAVNQAMVSETWVEPVADFFARYGVKTAFTLLALIGLYRIADIIPGVIANLFYQDMGFSKNEIASAVKTFGVIVSIVGGFLGGLFANQYGVMRSLMLGALLAAVTNLVFVWLAFAGHDIAVMYIAVTIDNLAAGFASAAFVAFLSSLTSVSFTAVQYAIFSSLMTLLPKTLGGYSGMLVDSIGYPGFFICTTLIGIPVLWLVWLANKHLQPR